MLLWMSPTNHFWAIKSEWQGPHLTRRDLGVSLSHTLHKTCGRKSGSTCRLAALRGLAIHLTNAYNFFSLSKDGELAIVTAMSNLVTTLTAPLPSGGVPARGASAGTPSKRPSALRRPPAPKPAAPCAAPAQAALDPAATHLRQQRRRCNVQGLLCKGCVA